MLSNLFYSFSLRNAAVHILSAAFLYAALRAIYQLFLSPIKKIPGPWYAAISNVWATMQLLCMQQCKSIHALFDTYGSVVRIGPNKVIFRDSDSMKNVYSVLKFEKINYYRSFLL
jgi:hypothetical protein